MGDINWMELLMVALAALAGAIVPAIASVYASFKAKAAADGVQDWKDFVVTFVDDLAEEIDEDEEVQ
jgi:hypothetical protein